MDDLTELIDLIKLTAKIVVNEFISIPEDKLSMQGDRWTVSDHIKHACNSERGLLWVLNNILEGGEGASSEFDLDKYNASNRNKMNDTTISDMIDEFKIQREATLELVKTITENSLRLKGRHASQRIFTVAEMLLIIAIHPLHHMKEISRIVDIKFDYNHLVDKFTSLFN